LAFLKSHAFAKLFKLHFEIEALKHFNNILRSQLVLAIDANLVAHDRIPIGQENVLRSLVPIYSIYQVRIEHYGFLKLFHGLQPKSELILNFQNFNDLRENVQKLRNIHFKPHFLAFLGDFGNEV
jgi:hypothetical protein